MTESRGPVVRPIRAKDVVRAAHGQGTNAPAPARCYTWPAPYGGTST
jgi:hypothetical protein